MKRITPLLLVSLLLHLVLIVAAARFLQREADRRHPTPGMVVEYLEPARNGEPGAQAAPRQATPPGPEKTGKQRAQARVAPPAGRAPAERHPLAQQGPLPGAPAPPPAAARERGDGCREPGRPAGPNRGGANRLRRGETGWHRCRLGRSLGAAGSRPPCAGRAGWPVTAARRVPGAAEASHRSSQAIPALRPQVGEGGELPAPFRPRPRWLSQRGGGALLVRSPVPRRSGDPCHHCRRQFPPAAGRVQRSRRGVHHHHHVYFVE